MAYGLKAETANGQLIIDGGSNRYKGFQVVTARTNGFVSNYTAGDLVFAQRSSNGVIGANLPTSTFSAGITHHFVARTANSSGFSSSGTYGLQVKNQNGDIAFDSRNSAGGTFAGFSIERVYPPNTLSGGSSGTAGPATGDDMITNIDPSDYYLLVLGSMYQVNSTGDIQTTFNWGGAYFDHTNNKIKYVGYLDLVNSGTEGPASSKIPFPNVNTMILAKYIA